MNQFIHAISEQRKQVEQRVMAMEAHAIKSNEISFMFFCKKLARILDNYFGGSMGGHMEIGTYTFKLVFNSRIQPDGCIYTITVFYSSHMDEMFIASGKTKLYGEHVPAPLPFTVINMLKLVIHN